MKVLHVIPSVGEKRGGPSRAILDMVRALRQQGADAVIATTDDNGADRLTVPLQAWINFAGVPVQFFARFSPPQRAIREFSFSWPLTTWLHSHLPEYDLVHVHAIFSYASTAAMLLARWHGVPYLTTLHGMLGEWPLQQNARKKLRYFSLVEQGNLQAARLLHFTADQEQSESRKLGLQSPSVVIPHGLWLPATMPDARAKLRQMLGVLADETLILFLSRIHPVKGLDQLIPALARCSQHRFTFVLAGSGEADYEQQVAQMLQTHGLAPHTRTIGFVRGPYKELLLQGADLFVMPSHSENFGIAALEALAAGLPVLITPGIPLASIVAQHQLGYVAEMNIASIATKLQEFFAYRQTASAMGQRARQFVTTHYAWEQIAANLNNLYDMLLANRLIGDLVSNHT